MTLMPGVVMHTWNSISQEAEAGESGVDGQPKLDSRSSSQKGQQGKGESETLRWGENDLNIHCVLKNYHSYQRSEDSQTNKTHLGLQETKEVFGKKGNYRNKHF